MRQGFRLIPIAMVIIIAGCSSNTPKETPVTMDDVYARINSEGKKETIATLRQGLSMNYREGTHDPYTPIRKPSVVAPIYVPTMTNPRTGERIAGHWKYIEIEEAGWLE